MELLQKLQEMNLELEALKKQHLEKSKTMFNEICKDLFNKHPKLESFGWTQYTPYFNDGDECVFSVHIDEPDINGVSGYDLDFVDETITEYGDYDSTTRSYPNKKELPNPNYDKELSEAQKEVVEFLNSIDEDVFRAMFGDHVEITVSKDGVDVSEHEHV